MTRHNRHYYQMFNGVSRYKIRLVVFHVYMMVTFSTERYLLNHVHFSVFLLITTVESGNILPTNMASIMEEWYNDDRLHTTTRTLCTVPYMAKNLLFSVIMHKCIYYEHCFIHLFLQLTFVYLQVAFLSFSLVWSNKARSFNTRVLHGHNR